MHRHSRRSHAVGRALLGLLLAVGVGVAGLAWTRPTAAASETPAGPTGNTGCPASNPPNMLALVAGTPQTAQLDSAFASGLQVTLANTNGCPVTTAAAGTAVTFAAPSSGASGIFSASGASTLTVGTDAGGTAGASMFTVDGTAGSYAVTATCVYGSVSFELTNTAAGLAATITPLAPAHQSATASTRYSEPLAVRVLDGSGTALSGVTVTFALGSSGGGGSGASGSGAASPGASFDDGSAQASEQTNSDGVATSPHFSANSLAGTFTATAATAHITEPASFTLDNLAAEPATVVAIAGTYSSATVDTHYRQRLKVRVRQGNGSPAVGATVTFTLGSTAAGASAAAAAGVNFYDGTTQASATTNQDGIATSPRFRANSTAGSLTATATLSGTTSTARFTLHNRAGAPTAVTPGVALTESATTGSRFAIPLAVMVSDTHKNPVPGALVTFTAPASGPSGSFAVRSHPTRVKVRTDASGIAIAPAFVANAQQGGYIVTATVKHARTAAFALVNQAA